MAAPSTNFFPNAHHFNVGEQHFHINELQGVPPMEKLEKHIAAEALHDSEERCDAPKCHAETRIAVQEDLYGWAVHGDADNMHKMKWVTGPAGTGKTAVMGSVAERCKKDGVFVLTFFFSAVGPPGRRTKLTFVPTIAHQLAHHEQNLHGAIASAIKGDPIVFKKNTQTQMDTLVLGPLRAIAGRLQTKIQGVILVDGLDECGVDRTGGTTATELRAEQTSGRSPDDDQLEILQALHAAAIDPAFPFRILIASRSEPVFRQFFDPPSSFAKKVDLHEHYNADADADLTLYLEAQFSRIGRRYNISLSWPPPGAIPTLVKKASGQFVYAATVIRFLDTDRSKPPEALLNIILKIGTETASKPLPQLDILYSHILNSSPDPRLAVKWILAINEYSLSVSNMNLFLQSEPPSSEAEYLLGSLRSLIKIRDPSRQDVGYYDFYHKSLFDFLDDPHRCGKLHVGEVERNVFIWEAFLRSCSRGCDIPNSMPEGFLKFLAVLPGVMEIRVSSAHSRVLPTPASADWWASMAITHQGAEYRFWDLFRGVHDSCRWYYRCKPACRIWSRSLLRQLGSATWIAPGLLWLARRTTKHGSTPKEYDKFLGLFERRRSQLGVA